jgi:ATP-dependent exoDNAse (exonuclease V) beta subunit
LIRSDYLFDFNLIEFTELNTEEVNGKRHYITPDGKKYPSVTTVLSEMSDKTGLLEWRKRVGEEEANRVTTKATKRGTKIHAMCEDYIQSESTVDQAEIMPIDTMMFKQIKAVLDSKVNNIRAVECPLYSNHLKVAGRCDLVAEYDGRLAIIDYKTSKTYKREDWIQNYFKQAALYSYMLWEMTGEKAKDIVIIIAIEDSNGAQVIRKKAQDYILEATKMVADYHKKQL